MKPMITDSARTRLKVRPTRMAMDAGMTIIAETRRAPATGIIKAMAIPVTTLKRVDMSRTGRPSTNAVSSSKVITYIGRMKRTKTTKTTTARMANKMTWV